MTHSLTAIIRVEPASIGGETIQTVNARTIHAFLGIRKDFSDWIKAQIDRGRLVEGRDYVLLPQKGEQTGRGGRNRNEYHVTIRAGQHIAMMSGGEKGFEVRDYFIECEYVAKDPDALAKAYIEKLRRDAVNGAAAQAKLDAIMGTPARIRRIAVEDEPTPAVRRIVWPGSIQPTRIAAQGPMIDGWQYRRLINTPMSPSQLGKTVGCGEHAIWHGLWSHGYVTWDGVLTQKGQAAAFIRVEDGLPVSYTLWPVDYFDKVGMVRADT